MENPHPAPALAHQTTEKHYLNQILPNFERTILGGLREHVKEMFLLCFHMGVSLQAIGGALEIELCPGSTMHGRRFIHGVIHNFLPPPCAVFAGPIVP